MIHRQPHRQAVLQALFVTFLWSTSWVLIKFGLEDIPALTFAGLRYSLAFLCLLPFAWTPATRQQLRTLTRRNWAFLILLGVLFYAVTQGAQFVGLAYLPAVSVNLLLNLTSFLVAMLGIAFLGEKLGKMQWIGTFINLGGVLLYFYPVAFPAGQVFGLLIVLLGVFSNAISAVLGRSVNRDGSLHPLLITTVSMGIGAGLLLVSGLLAQGLPALSPLSWLIIAWLAVVNTAFAFTLWNHTLRTLSAMESSIINSTMLIQITLLAWIFLGESLDFKEIAGLALAGLGALLVQLRKKPEAVETV